MQMVGSIFSIPCKYSLLSTDVFRFTLYWTIIFYIPPFLICGFYAFWNYAFPPSPRTSDGPNTIVSEVQMSNLDPVSPEPKSNTHARPAMTNERRSRVTFAIIVLLTFLALSLAGAVIGSAILGFVAFGLYKSANFNMSTYDFTILSAATILNLPPYQLGTFSACRYVRLDWPSEVNPYLSESTRTDPVLP